MESDLYKVKDLYEAALLYTKDMPLENLEWERDVCFFVFRKRSECEELSNEYWKGGLLIDSMKFTLSVKKLKERIFSHK